MKTVVTNFNRVVSTSGVYSVTLTHNDTNTETGHEYLRFSIKDEDDKSQGSAFINLIDPDYSQSIVSQLAMAAGFEAGEEVDTEELAKKKIIVSAYIDVEEYEGTERNAIKYFQS